MTNCYRCGSSPCTCRDGCTLICGDCLEVMAGMEAGSVQTCVTSPPYWGLRDYGVDGQLGLESTPEAYVAKMVEVFQGVWRVLRDDGTLWLNLGDTYCSVGGPGVQGKHGQCAGRVAAIKGIRDNRGMRAPANGIKNKDLVGIPWRVAFALQADGWYLRQDIIWCLSGGARIYAKTQKGEMPMMVKDMARLDPATVQLWNGEKWTQLLGMSQTVRTGEEIELTLQSGERIGCTPGHQWPTDRGLLRTADLKVGDVVSRCQLPEPCTREPFGLLDDIGWFVGHYIAEGSRSGGTMQIACHSKEREKYSVKWRGFAERFGGSVHSHDIGGDAATICVEGKVPMAIIDTYVAGRVAKNKGLKVACWQRSDAFLRYVLYGYLLGDGHWEPENDRWRLGFTRNDRLASDLRTLAARLGEVCRLRPGFATCNGKKYPTYRGEWRHKQSGHHNCKPLGQIVAIGKSRARKFWDIGVADEPHTFALASGLLTHNSKPNPMPESVTDRCTKAHEYLFLLSKSGRYYWDAEAIKEPLSAKTLTVRTTPTKGSGCESAGEKVNTWMKNNGGRYHPTAANKRSVWSVSSRPYKGAHFAVFPEKLVEPCIKAGTSEEGCCPECGAPWVRETTKERVPTRPGTNSKVNRASDKDGSPYHEHSVLVVGNRDPLRHCTATKTTGWTRGCKCGVEHGEPEYSPVPCTVLDPFMGSGTVAEVARKNGCRCVGIELNEEYLQLAARRLKQGVLF